MDELEKWAKDKPKFLVMLSVYIATAADSFKSCPEINTPKTYEVITTAFYSQKLGLTLI